MLKLKEMLAKPGPLSPLDLRNNSLDTTSSM
jgi:hypothetical protein